VCSMCCRKISDRIIDEEAPIASPSLWKCVCVCVCVRACALVLLLWKELFCFVMTSNHVRISCLMLESIRLFSC
jgi:hypothetical protein